MPNESFDPMAAVYRDQAEEARRAAEYRRSPEGQREKTIELLARVVELLEAQARR
jgi:hypothetical protein